MKKEEIDKLLTCRIKEVLENKEIPGREFTEVVGMNINVLNMVCPERTEFIPGDGDEKENRCGHLEVVLDNVTITCVIENNVCRQAMVFQHVDSVNDLQAESSEIAGELTRQVDREKVLDYWLYGILPGEKDEM